MGERAGASLVKSGWLAPSLADLLVAALAVRPYFLGPGWNTLLNDANVGLHILTGDMIRATGHAPATEPFSFTLPSKPWFAWEWLTEVLASALHSWAGLGAVAVGAVALLAVWTALIYSTALHSSGKWTIAAVLTMLVSQASANHILARPHLITWVLLAWTVRLCLGNPLGQGRALWWLAALSALWANLHGGFLLLPVYLGVTAAGLVAEWLLGRGAERRQAALRYGALSTATMAATVLNPYGVKLHAHISEYLRSGWLRQMVEEYHAPSPKLGEQYYWFCALAALTAIACLSQLRRREVAQAAAALCFAAAAFQSARHIPVFLTVALPVMAAEAGRALQWFEQRGGRRSLAAAWSDLDRGMLAHASRYSVWLPAFFAVALAMPSRLGAPGDFPAQKFPAQMLAAHGDSLDGTRLFTTDVWADYVAYHRYPRVRVFVDGMNDFFGPDIGNEYLEMLEAGPRTEERFRAWNFTAALVPVKGPLAEWLKGRPEWRLVAEDRQAALFRKD
ncbi:MAG: hypothetical protein HY821_08010 [Acidobacteria bacterium]|nr:hypothetical protein [Acidobacteriota bacterium]